jgi:hypothetical protein
MSAIRLWYRFGFFIGVQIAIWKSRSRSVSINQLDMVFSNSSTGAITATQSRRIRSAVG